jgi:REP element-mobilizing transposase RayT
MQINLLAYTTDHELLTRLRLLTANGETITVQPVGTIEELHDLIGQQHFDAALVDMTNNEVPMDMLTLNLSEGQPGIRVMVLPPENNEEIPLPLKATNFRLLNSPLHDEELVTALQELTFLPDPAVDQHPANTDLGTSEESQAAEDHEPSLIEIIDAAMNESMEAQEPQAALDSASDEEPDLLAVLEASQAKGVTTPQGLVDTVPPEISTLRLSYCCVLVPRHPRQYLARDLADRAASILPQLHLSRGWRVTGISVRPQFLQWIISLPLETCPVEAIEEIRQRTSAYFYTHFPELRSNEQNFDFWAPGYLMMSGSQPLSPAIIREFIQRVHTRPQRGD